MTGTETNRSFAALLGDALATDRVILTRDRRARFDDLSGVGCLMAG